MRKRVLLGMSSGIDSSVSAMLLQEQGYDVVGITFLFGGSVHVNETISRDAKLLADKLDIKHLTVNLQTEFKNSVIKYFKDEYSEGRTPFPCAFCNPKIKFFYLQEYANIENCEFIATGHYVKTDDYNGRKYIFQGADPDKDQSFFLWGLPRELIEKLIFPLGKFDKTQIRQMAKERGFKTLSKKKDSLGICFIDGNDYRKFLKEEGIKSNPGNFVDANGAILGKHQGITNYTIGQRRGLGLNLNYPVFVAKIALDDNEIVLTKYDDLYKTKIMINNYYFVDNQDINGNKQLIVKVRYRLQQTPCEVHILDDVRAEVVLLEPEAMIADGQTAVFFDGERLVGGGFIESSE
ncbi:MAG: tRNA 2-thiouridine(34) synthase MnmA [Bacteroidetes bacterium]|nr:tRNA 2-thiouridine(34) synthase MnmA [Bacteroidota bacterium]